MINCFVYWFAFFNSYQNLTFSAGNLFFLDFTGNNNVSEKNNLLVFFFAAAFDKGDDRRLGRKPVLSSCQVNSSIVQVPVRVLLKFILYFKINLLLIKAILRGSNFES